MLFDVPYPALIACLRQNETSELRTPQLLIDVLLSAQSEI